MNFLKCIFPSPTKEKTIEDLAYWRGRLDIAIQHEKMKKYIDSSLLAHIEEMNGKVAKLEARLKTFK